MIVGSPLPVVLRFELLFSVAMALLLVEGSAQDAKKSEEKLPRVVVAVPLGIVAGKTNIVEIRGLNLDTAKALPFSDAAVTARITAKGKADVPQNQKKERFGDTQVKAEVFVPVDFKGDEAAFFVETPDGKSTPAKLAVLRPGAFAEEVEDNGSFSKPQMLTLPTTLRGRIQAPQDVDVFAFEGKAGQRITAEILAARLGSPLDATLTLWDARNTLLASADDSPGDRDPRLAFTLPASCASCTTRKYRPVAGSATHGYLLKLEGK
ncbi:MAG: hypothetical protein EB082_07460 [Verrucomicrobia bacterium]|nr:hypothetical protein [Verrucomicrobiota bacterium]